MTLSSLKVKQSAALAVAMTRKFSKDARGATAIEYGLMASLIGVMMITGASAAGTEINTLFSDIARAFDAPPEEPQPAVSG